MKKHKIIIFMIIVFIITGGKCLIKKITGFPCPSCGVTRAFYHLLNFDIGTSFKYNPLFIFIPTVLLICIYGKRPLLGNKKGEKIFFFISISLILGIYLYRMITLFPDIRPMDYNYNSYLWNIYKYIKGIL